MALNLYTYHKNKKLLVGYDKREENSELILNKISAQYKKPDVMKDLLLKFRDVLDKSPQSARRAAGLFKRATKNAKTREERQLWPLGHAVEKVVAQDPNSLCYYLTHYDYNPKYNSQILKADNLNAIGSYIIAFEKELRKDPKFFTQLLNKFVHNPQESYELAMYMNLDQRVIPLEPAIFRFDPDPDSWRSMHYRVTVRTPAKSGNREGEQSSPWNLYVANLHNVKDRVDAIKQYGFKGQKFVLGTRVELNQMLGIDE